MIDFCLIFAAIALLSLSMNKHYKDSFSKALNKKQQRVMKIAGWALLVVSLIMIDVKGINYVYWCCQLSLAIVLQASVLVFAKNYNAKR